LDDASTVDVVAGDRCSDLRTGAGATALLKAGDFVGDINVLELSPLFINLMGDIGFSLDLRRVDGDFTGECGIPCFEVQ
jgi:hypothetical protein